ncbi:peptidoglycan synthetase FtsI [Desulfocicer vacuolatum DSM 3385]|uniref:Peptidoglycan synthetase FtsI n=1 Tax=Desulfocicer vacuolatum DSM 3385 TaxID=1121400 RepID=A0A1W1YHC0_9BACT|nr:penicillin-binding protein 2 [Desulfocicer vacuolatum]SMC35534.1 peptidoglycan synthetase FtsI [Desulfocicer vacuolatum DSM 3385]
MNPPLSRKIARRIRLVEIVFGVIMVLIGARAVMLQLFNVNKLADKADKDLIKTIEIKGKRGNILDRHMKKLSTSLDAVSIAAAPEDIKSPHVTARTLSPLLHMEESLIADRLASNKKFVWLKKKLSPGEGKKIKALNIPGILTMQDTIRFHPSRELAAQVIGITGWNNRGKEGLEFKFDEILRGKTKKITVKKTTRQSTQEMTRELSGNSLVLTIDKTIQYITEMALKDAVTDNGAQSGMAIVMEPDTGDILAMAHYPLFNPNAFGEFDPNNWRNRAVTDAFEPGSTLKIFLAAGALEQGISSPDTPFFCGNGSYALGSRTIRDTHAHGWLTLAQIIKVSSNIGVAKVAQLMGKNKLHTTLTRFGFGNKTGIACPIETKGTLMPPAQWSIMDTAAIAFGQAISVSAIQLACAVSAIANRGILMVPRLIRAVIAENGTARETYPPKVTGRAVSEKTASSVTRMMASVVQKGGTGTRAYLPGYGVCGKTGTAQKAIPHARGYSDNNYTALFVGFAPPKKPRLTCLVIVDEPRKSHYGGTVAAPAFKTILQKTFNYLNIPPDMGKYSSNIPSSPVWGCSQPGSSQYANMGRR